MVEQFQTGEASSLKASFASIVALGSLLAGCACSKPKEPLLAEARQPAKEPVRGESVKVPDQQRKVCEAFDRDAKEAKEAIPDPNPIVRESQHQREPWRLLNAFHEIMGDSGEFEGWIGKVYFEVHDDWVWLWFFPSCGEHRSKIEFCSPGDDDVVSLLYNDHVTIRLRSPISESLKSVTPASIFGDSGDLVEASGRLFYLREIPPGSATALAHSKFPFYNNQIREHPNYIGVGYEAFPPVVDNTAFIFYLTAQFASVRKR